MVFLWSVSSFGLIRVFIGIETMLKILFICQSGYRKKKHRRTYTHTHTQLNDFGFDFSFGDKKKTREHTSNRWCVNHLQKPIVYECNMNTGKSRIGNVYRLTHSMWKIARQAFIMSVLYRYRFAFVKKQDRSGEQQNEREKKKTIL